MNAFNYIIDKHEPSAAHKDVLEAILTKESSSSSSRPEPRAIPLPGGVDGCVVVDALSPEECDAIVKGCEGIGYTFWSDPSSGGEDAAKQQQQHTKDDDADGDDKKHQPQSGSNFRTAYTIEVNLPSMSRLLWERVRKFVSPTVTFTPEAEDTYQRDLDGTWHVDGFCENLLFARYRDGGHFAPHVDGQSVLTFNRRSMYTALFYLNDCDGGGETVFHAGDQCAALSTDAATGKVTGHGGTAKFKWKPRRGSCSIFRFDALHEGAPVVKGHEKYIIRGDLEFERKPPVCDDENGRKAFALYERARKLEAEGDTDGAVKLFIASRKVSRELAEILQIL